MEDREFGSWLSQTNDLKMLACHFLAWHLTLIEYGKDRLAQCPDNVTEGDVGSWCQRPDFIVGKHYEVTMNVHCRKSGDILISH